MFTYYYIIALSQISSTLQIISHLVRHNLQSEIVTTNSVTIKHYIYIYIYNWAIGLMSRVFANGPGD